MEHGANSEALPGGDQGNPNDDIAQSAGDDPCAVNDEGAVSIRYVAQKRRSRKPTAAAVAFAVPPPPPKRTTGAQELKAPFRRTLIHVANKPPRFPPGAWPLEMRADTAAAYLDFPSTREMCKAISRGEAPRPNATRGSGPAIEVVWYSKSIEEFVARRNRAK